jgi:hypothetical protein
MPSQSKRERVTDTGMPATFEHTRESVVKNDLSIKAQIHGDH